MMVVPEGGSLYFNNVSMVLDGHTGVEHSIPVPAVYDDIERLWGASSTGYTPTTIVGYGGLSGEFYFYQHYDVWENEHLLAFTPREQVDARSRRRLMAAGDDDWNHILIARGAKDLYDAGVMTLLGAHGQLEGLGAHWELWMFEQGGMSAMEALAAGTIMGAQYLGMDGDIGSLEPGKLADLVVLTANPLDDITHTDDIAQVMLGGRLYDAMTLRQVAPVERAAPVMPWER
ncbi:MAG TPA: amidohydrolase family protein, partial [Gemmatimonadota bacterium]|nr:amidohydrolase family protein [Gemmatimonadota bacterium]